ncbi:TonB-dependent receptor [Novosphingobium mangrovi (ex Huang et al. 2023)]|uniref:TonB-dependent receptor n=1 Tax=Novosphingobium mangrovi (ex Huang et al. 2023) TaxID=2976432 RepID=A0ABT2I9N7_9SPHN|nr:TonB-dependent receptor [Novosphingobium mangrovi (ex Huang et al. 2023)]MCT2401550.1 TonB-dependent receptor [Novosphingobium mangrovi (ex Huang et al. 2023)]
MAGSILAGGHSAAFAEEAPAAEAQADSAGDDSSSIIVTAQKYRQRAVDVPLTMTVESGERMRELGVTDLGDLSNYVPGLNVQVQSANNPGFVIRGITSDSGSAQQAPRVTLYYNGVDISRSRGAYQGLYDLERIEVLKGPQATLFGTAATIGAISLISTKPKAGVSAQLTGGYGNYDAYKLEGYVNAGSDVLAGRVAWQWKKRDGYVPNLAPGQEDLYAQDQLGLRGSLRFTPTSDFTADLIVTYDRQRNSGTPFLSKALGSTAVDGVYGPAYLGGSPYSAQVLGASKLGLHRDVYDVNFTASWDFADGWNFTTVNGYRDFDALEVFDADGSAAWYLEFAEHAKGWEASHEGRFTYSDDQWRASFGWNYFIEDSYQNVPFSTEEGTYLQCTLNIIPGLGCVAPDNTVPASLATGLATGGLLSAVPYASWFENKGRNQSWSMFGDATWKPTPELELTAGARVLIEKRKSGYGAYQPNSVLAGVPLLPLANTGGDFFYAERSYEALLPRFNVLYHITPTLNLYATVSEGRRSPVVQLSAAPGPVPALDLIPAEKVWNYEAGIKGTVGMFSGSLGVYYDDYSNFQVTIVDAATGVTRTESAGSAANLGVEGEIEARFTEWLRAFGNFGFISGGVDDKASNGVYAGNQFRLQPKWQWSAGFMLNAPVTESARVFLAPSVTYRSKIYFELPNSEPISQGPVTLVNVRGGVSFANDRFEIAGYARNLTDKRYLLDAGNTGGGFGYPTFIPAEPRTYGIELTARY